MGSWKFSTLKSIRIIAFIDLVSVIVIFRFRLCPFSLIHETNFLSLFHYICIMFRGLYFIHEDVGHKTNSFGDCLFCTRKTNNNLFFWVKPIITHSQSFLVLFCSSFYVILIKPTRNSSYFSFVSDCGRDICRISGCLPLHPTRENSHKKWQRTDWNKHSH